MGDEKMDTIIINYLSKLEFGEPLHFKNMGVIPLFTSIDHSLEYLTLKEALEKRLLTITEVSHGGSVPELKVTNKAEIPVLLLDGEELVGAKQNRTLNTSILLKKKSETIIPVSCTEQGRWSYVSEEFDEADLIASPKLRAMKARSVTVSLEKAHEYMANQAEIWDEIDEMSAHAEVRSPTGAMRDIFEDKMNSLNEYLKAFKYVPSQKGLLAIINGEVAGFDIISLESAYKILHPKLLKSYAMDALLQKEGKSGKLSVDKAKAFLKETAICKENKYKSIGHGWDYRFEAKTIVGSALVYRKKVIHTTFFRTSESDKAGRMAGYRRRRDFRI